MCAALTVTCCTFKNWDPISLPGIAYPLATMLTVLWETLRCCITLYCVVRLGLIMSWPNMFQFGSPILHAVVASGLTIWTSTYGMEPVLCNRLLIEPSGWCKPFTCSHSVLRNTWLNIHAVRWMRFSSHLSVHVFTISQNLTSALFFSSAVSDLSSDWSINCFLRYVCCCIVEKDKSLFVLMVDRCCRLLSLKPVQNSRQ